MEVAGANRRWRWPFRCRGSRHESAVAQLFSLGHLAMPLFMRGIMIRDLVETGGCLAVDLRHILDLFGERAVRSRWRASEVWATGKERGEAAQELDALADGQTFIAGEHLSRIAHRLVQVIDGEFSAFESGS